SSPSVLTPPPAVPVSTESPADTTARNPVSWRDLVDSATAEEAAAAPASSPPSPVAEEAPVSAQPPGSGGALPSAVEALLRKAGADLRDRISPEKQPGDKDGGDDAKG
ncbi:MAG TPA: hypothetical protein PKX87_09165, partial [Alphaproteobacteria bacterium]|nr:hypothetical protein [Alphaproteobacteria bacterium]